MSRIGKFFLLLILFPGSLVIIGLLAKYCPYALIAICVFLFLEGVWQVAGDI